MSTGGVLGNGLKVAWASGSPMVWNKIPQILDFTFPTEQSDKVDKTIHGTVKYHSYMQGLVEVGDAVITALWDVDEVTSPQFEALAALRDAGTEVYWAVEVPVNRAQTRFKRFEFVGYVSQISPATPIDDKQSCEYTIVYSGTYGISRYASGASILG